MSCNQAHPSQFEMLRRILGLVCSVCGIEMSIMQRLGACDLSLGLRVGIDLSGLWEIAKPFGRLNPLGEQTQG